MTIATVADLRERLAGVATITDTGLEVHDESRLRGALMDDLAFAAALAEDGGVRDAARWVIWSASQALGCGSASIHELYMARGRGEIEPNAFTVPAINVRATTYLTARQAFAAALQRDHFQFNRTKWGTDPSAELDGLKELTREAIAAGFLNIDIDSSTLVDLDQPTVPEQQKGNADNSAELTRLIRELQPDGVTISIGGEIGEVGKANSTEEELRAYLDEYRRALGDDTVGVSKVSIQTGTSHCGVPLPGGGVA